MEVYVVQVGGTPKAVFSTEQKAWDYMNSVEGLNNRVTCVSYKITLDDWY